MSETERAYKMLRVEFSEHSGDASPGDGFVAAGTEGATFAVIVSLTVRLAFMLEEWTAVEGLSAFLQNKHIFINH